jgi:uncharacterized membrane protein
VNKSSAAGQDLTPTTPVPNWVRGTLVWGFKHWLLLVNLFIGTYVGLAIASPLLIVTGWKLPGQMIFEIYGLACHQLPSRTFYLFEHPIAFCQRDLAIYGTIFFAGLAYNSMRLRLRPLSWKVWLLAALPMALDGATQLTGLRESVWELRSITGILFGVSTVWLLFPTIDTMMRLEQS